MAWVCLGGGVTAVTKGDGQLRRPWAPTHHERKAFGKCSQPLRHLGAWAQAGPRRQQGWACCDLAPGEAARSGDHGTTYSQSCCSRQAQGKCSQHLRVSRGVSGWHRGLEAGTA